MSDFKVGDRVRRVMVRAGLADVPIGTQAKVKSISIDHKNMVYVIWDTSDTLHSEVWPTLVYENQFELVSREVTATEAAKDEAARSAYVYAIPPDANTMLTMIDRFLSGTEHTVPEQREMLQHVLAALRGPDSELDEAKWSMTVPVRRAALPLTYKHAVDDMFGHAANMSFGFTYRTEYDPEDYKLYCVSRNLDGWSWHFEHHIMSAVNALSTMGRTIEISNKEKEKGP